MDESGAPGGRGGGNGGAPGPSWRDQLVRNREGKCVGSYHNVMLIAQRDPLLQGVVALDGFANRIVRTRETPLFDAHSEEWTETDATRLAAWLGRPDTYGMSIKPAVVMDVIAAVADDAKFHPVQDYLHGLQWDGVERVPRLFADYFGADDTDYAARVSVIFLLSAVSRILAPGCKVDTMLIFEGAQGAGKTRATQTLFGGDKWYMDAQRSPSEKDFYQDLVGKWGVEVGEMTSFTKAEANRVKQTLSATADTYRPSYGRYSRTFPRQCVFIGTTNEDQYLRDPTGARRYLPVRVSVVQVGKLEADRDQLWAEAVARRTRGETWWELPRGTEDAQEQRYMEDSWCQPIARWLMGGKRENYPDGIDADDSLTNPVDYGPVRSCTTHELLRFALGIDTARHSRADQMRVSAIMRQWQWNNLRVVRNGARIHLWERPLRPPSA